jgi:hypothetical protein
MRGRLATAAVITALLALVAGCGGGGDEATTSAVPPPPTSAAQPPPTVPQPPTTAPTAPPAQALLPDVPAPVLTNDDRLPRESSVGDGYGPAPAIDPAVRRAAEAAGCTVQAFPSGGRSHLAKEASFRYLTDPPTSGDHYPIWADWGVYDHPVPNPVQVHNLEHGGVVIHVGPEVSRELRRGIGELWASSPPYMLVVPGAGANFPPAALVVTSWQRWMVCKPYTEQALEAIRVFRDSYRARGPEPVAGLDSGVVNDFPGMPQVAVPDPGAG